MAKPRTRAPVGSLSNMATKVRDQKAASKNKPVELKSAKFAKDATSSSEASGSGSGSDSDSGSGSSDDNDVDIEAARKKYAAKLASKRKASEKEKPKSVPTKPASTKPTSKAATTSPDDSESEGSQTSSTEASIPNTPKATTTKTNGTKTNGAKDAAKNKSESSSETSSEESDSESDSESESEAKKAGVHQSDAAGSQDESSDAASEIGSDSDEEPNNDQGSAIEIDGEETAVSRVNGQSAAESSAAFPRPRWLNNSNFAIRKAMSDNPAQEVADFFSKTSLEGKQLWYFTAPASLSITILKDMEIDLTKAVTGDSLLQHNGDDFGIYRESEATNTQIQLLIPSPAGDSYTPLSRGLNDTVHLRRIAKFGPDGAISATATDEYTPTPKPIRQQPQNLKPRFTPIGVPTATPPPVESLKTRPALATETGESEVDSDQDMTDVGKSQMPETPTRPKGSKKSSATNGMLKRKHPEDEGDKSTSAKASTKRAKTTKSSTAKSSSTKETPVQPPTQPALSNGKSSNASTAAIKSKAKPAKKDKKDSRKSSVLPSKLTPVPVPSIPGMRR